MFNFFLDEHYNTVGIKTKEESGDIFSQALYLKKHLTEEIGRMLTKSAKYRKNKGLETSRKSLPGGLDKSEDVVVKDIQFAYNNYRVIEILKKRGTAIAQCKWDVVQ